MKQKLHYSRCSIAFSEGLLFDIPEKTWIITIGPLSKNINAPRYTLKKLFKNFCQFVKETHLEQFNITKVANSITSQVIPKELFSKKALNSCLCSCFVLFLHCRFGKHDPISFDLLNFPINYLPNISAYTFQTTPSAYTFLWKTGSASTGKAAEES